MKVSARAATALRHFDPDTASSLLASLEAREFGGHTSSVDLTHDGQCYRAFVAPHRDGEPILLAITAVASGKDASHAG